MKDVITKEHVFPHPIQKVWDAISKAEEISTWFINADFKAEKGYKYTFNATDEPGCTAITGEVKNADPYTLIYTWIVEGTDTETVVKWDLQETPEGTKLFLEHSGISKYPGDSAVSFFTSFDKGWDGCINKLTPYLAQQVHAG
ncbi:MULTISPECIES: SRPBCC domain-containing protein [Flavobacteriaceae]|uniref:SRPBCC family protein n=1 Tax=Flavobacteriaceae TaxID=49546 RepID=UPI0014925497|nr:MULTISPECIES: SRPBCC domain-containing protein [Allomuricauda]MDC6364676.1 SRPBCC domain-containing protein [Muricauda sp. AC10]